MSYDSDRAIEKARAVTAKYGTRDPWALAHKLPNVAVRKTDLGENIQGYSLVSRRMAIINLNSSMDAMETDSVLTHELGHSLLTRTTSTNYFYKNAGVAAVGSSEYIANCFMFQMLFGDRGGIYPLDRDYILDLYRLPAWMSQYFELIE